MLSHPVGFRLMPEKSLSRNRGFGAFLGLLLWVWFMGSSIFAQSSSGPDFNSDANVDILWRNYSTGQNRVWLMNGVSLSQEVSLDSQADLNWRMVATGDFDSDGKVDILWRNYSNGQNRVWLMNGTAYSNSVTLNSVADANWRIAGTGDFNGDGKVDILWHYVTTGRTAVWLMNGTSFLQFVEISPSGDSNWKIAGTGDFNSDGKVDILWRHLTSGQDMVWFMNGTTQSSSSTFNTVADPNWRIVATGDFDRDGRVDILWRYGTTGRLLVWYMDGITYRSAVEVVASSDLAWKIYDEDTAYNAVPQSPSGLTATAGNTQITLNWNASSGSINYIVKRSTTSGGPYANIATAVTTTSYANTGLTNGTTYYYVVSAVNVAGESGNSPEASATPQTAQPGPDFNSDANADILWRNYSTGQNRVWLMNGVSLSQELSLDSQADLNWRIAGTGDFNGDGKVDILWRNYSTGQNRVWLMNGVSLSQELSLDSQADLNWRIAGTGDFNGDGKVDILWHYFTTGRTAVWLMNGTSFLQFVEISPSGDPNWKITGTGDFNSDGKVDILWRHLTSGQDMVWFMNGTTQSSSSAFNTVTDPNWRIVATGDFDRDGRVDILWRYATTGRLVVWYMNGITYRSAVEVVPSSDLAWKIYDEDTTYTVFIPNQAPVVNAGQDQAITLPGSATLNGTASDDALPVGGGLTLLWSQTSGPGTATFINPGSATTTVSFSLPGTYVLRLTANDSQLSTHDDLTVMVNPPPVNQPPQVSAGASQTITLPNTASLQGTVNDDGLPSGSTVTVMWSQASGPGTAMFANPASVATTASFSSAGTYVLRLTASDTELTGFAEIAVEVYSGLPLPTITATVSPTPNADGWNKTGVTVSFTCVPGSSPISTCPSSQTLTAEGANQEVEGTVVDQAGNTATAHVTLNIDKTQPVVSSRLAPQASPAGWNNSDVILTFDCVDILSGISVCPESAGITAETAGQLFSSSVEDRAGNSNSVSNNVRVDKTAPDLAITSPANGTELATSTVSISGTLQDALSGIGSVTCNNIAGVVSGSAFTCDVPLIQGENHILVKASDLARNATSASLTVTTTTGQAISSIEITPGKATLLVDETVQLKLVDDFGRLVTGAAWAISNPSLAVLSTDDVPTLTALGAGDVTVTASWQGLSTQAEITVLSGTSLPAGTVRWSVPGDFGKLVQAMPSGEEGAPDFYALKESYSGGWNVTVRSLTSDGQGLWTTQVPGTMVQATSDSQGGLLLEVNPGGGETLLTRLDPLTGSQSWSYGTWWLAERWAVHPDGTVYIVDKDSEALLAVDENNGSVRFAVPLPRSSGVNTWGMECYEEIYYSIGGQETSAPTVGPDGSVYLEVLTADSVNLCPSSAGPTWFRSLRNDLSLLKVQPNGAYTVSPLASYAGTDLYDTYSVEVGEVIPEGDSGVLAAWNRVTNRLYPNLAEREAMVTRVAEAGQNEYQLPSEQAGWTSGADGTMVLGEEGVVFGKLGGCLMAFEAASGTVRWTWQPASGWVELVAASAGGGVVVQDGSAVVKLDANGSVISGDSFSLDSATYWTLGQWHGFADGQLASVSGFLFNLALTPFPVREGNFQKQHASPKPVLVHFVPVDPAPPDLTATETSFEDNLVLLSVPRLYATHRFYLKESANPIAFLQELAKKPVEAIGFIGHSILRQNHDTGPAISTGLFFYNGIGLQIPPTPPEWEYPADPNSIPKPKLVTQAKVIFIASCHDSELFKLWWDIDDATIGRALILAPDSDPLLGHASGAWTELLHALLIEPSPSANGKIGKSIDEAVAAVNKYMTDNHFTGIWRKIGDGNVRIKR